MKKIVNKLIGVLVIIFFIIPYIFPLISLADNSYKTYVALGDSIAYGYGLSNREKDSYAAKVSGKYNVKTSDFKNLAVSGMTCAEFYVAIQKSDYTQAIKEANLVTISIGSNELLGIVTKSVSEVTGIPSNDPGFLIKAQEKFLSAGILEKGKMLKAIYDIFTSEETKLEIENAIKSYQENWLKSIKYIKGINPNIVIVATEFYNPYYEFSLGSYDLGGFVDENIQKMNQILTSSSNSETEYKIAKIYSAFNTTNPRLTNVNISTSNFNLDPHPNMLGHEVICTKILDALSNATTTSKKDIATLTISDISDQVYTGKEIEPVVTIKDGGTTLAKDIDFTVSYSNNIEIGEAKVTIIGIGNYKGNVIKTFNIKNREPKDISKLEIKLVENQVYTGIKIVPDVEIIDETKKLVKNTDYELKYQNNIDVGNAKITISGIGNYKGTKTVGFDIIAKDINTVTIQDIPDQIYTGKEIIPNILITDGSAKLTENQDYTILYKDNINAGKASIVINGKGNYKGTVSQEFNIIENTQTENKDISKLEITEIEDKIYTGKLITPEVRIKDGAKTLIKNSDYILSYNNNLNIGTGIINITGIGNYTGKIEKNFKIVAKDIHYTTIEDIITQTYTGKAIKPEIIITSDSIKLKEGQDYTLQYSNNVEEGTATIQIKGIGNYTGTKIKTFNIVKLQDNENTTNKNQYNNTLADKPLPFAGQKKMLVIAIICISMIAITSFLLYKKYNKYVNNKNI